MHWEIMQQTDIGTFPFHSQPTLLAVLSNFPQDQMLCVKHR